MIYDDYARFDCNIVVYECNIGKKHKELDFNDRKCTDELTPIKRLSTLEVINILNGKMQ